MPRRTLARKILRKWWLIVLLAALIAGFIYRVPLFRKARVLHAQHRLIDHTPPAGTMAVESRAAEFTKLASSPAHQSNATAALYWPGAWDDFPIGEVGMKLKWSPKEPASSYGLVYAGAIKRADGVERLVIVRVRQYRMPIRYSGNTPTDRVVLWASVLEPETVRRRGAVLAESPTAMCRDYRGGEYAISTARRDAPDPAALVFESIHREKSETLRLRIDNNDRVRVDSKDRIAP
jgi:hypothetical protein